MARIPVKSLRPDSSFIYNQLILTWHPLLSVLFSDLILYKEEEETDFQNHGGLLPNRSNSQTISSDPCILNYMKEYFHEIKELNNANSDLSYQCHADWTILMWNIPILCTGIKRRHCDHWDLWRWQEAQRSHEGYACFYHCRKYIEVTIRLYFFRIATARFMKVHLDTDCLPPMTHLPVVQKMVINNTLGWRLGFLLIYCHWNEDIFCFDKFY